MITISFHCRNKSFTPTSFLYKALSSNPLEASPCIYRDSFGNYRTKKKHTQKMLKISVPHTDLQFCPCYCLEGITGRFCNPGNLGREGKQLVLLLRRMRDEVKLCRHCLAFLLPPARVGTVPRQSRSPTKYFPALPWINVSSDTKNIGGRWIHVHWVWMRAACRGRQGGCSEARKEETNCRARRVWKGGMHQRVWFMAPVREHIV